LPGRWPAAGAQAAQDRRAGLATSVVDHGSRKVAGAGSPPRGPWTGLADLPRSGAANGGNPARLERAAGGSRWPCQLPAATGVPLARWRRPGNGRRDHQGRGWPARSRRPRSCRILAEHPIKPWQIPIVDLTRRDPGPFAAQGPPSSPGPLPGVLPGQSGASTGRPDHLGGRQSPPHPGAPADCCQNQARPSNAAGPMRVEHE